MKISFLHKEVYLEGGSSSYNRGECERAPNYLSLMQNYYKPKKMERTWLSDLTCPLTGYSAMRASRIRQSTYKEVMSMTFAGLNTTVILTAYWGKVGTCVLSTNTWASVT